MVAPRREYTTVVIEREIAAPRTVAFDALCTLISKATGGYVLDGYPVALYQGSTLFTGRGAACLMAWSLLIDPLPDGRSNDFVANAEAFLTRFADAVKARAEAEA